LGATHARVAIKRDGSVQVITTVRVQDFLVSELADPLDAVPDAASTPVPIDGRDNTQHLLDNESDRDETAAQLDLAEDVTVLILRQLKEAAEVHLNQSVTHAVVTVPPCQ
jgi:hypothetical protein